MLATFKKLYRNGTLRMISLLIGTVSLPIFIVLSILMIPGPIDWIIPLQLILFFLMCFSLILGYFLPQKPYKNPKSLASKASDSYLDHSPEEDFAKGKREAMLQESWMSVADRFNRTRAQ